MKQEKLVRVIRLNTRDIDSKNNVNVMPTSQKELKRLKASNGIDEQLKYKELLKLNRQYNKSKILIRESEIVRIVQCLNKENLEFDDRYPFVKDLIILKVKSVKAYRGLTECENQEDKGIITYNNVRYKNLICSSSNVRSHKVFFIRESMFDEVNKILLCGIPEDYPYKVFAKFNSYYGLVATDSIAVSMPNIVVIGDYKKDINEIFDVVTGNVSKEITVEIGKRKKKTKVVGYGEYKVVNNQDDIDKDMMPFDGAGLIDVSKMEEWKQKLKLSYLPAAVQFRMIPGIKGNLYTFDIKAFVKKLKSEGKSTTITDYWGKVWDFEKDNINCIMTKSQFKFADVYKDLAIKAGMPNDGFKIWHDEFIKECEGYKRTFNLSEISEPFKDLKDKCVLSYQPLQTLEFEQAEIEELCKDTVNKVKKVHCNLDEFLKYRGLVDEGKDDDRIPPFYEALKANHDLYYDPYIREKILNDLKKLKHRCYIGKLFVDGNYQVFTPDIYGLAEYAFGQEVIGLLKAGEIYSKYWHEKKVEDIDVIRSPHIACEHCVVKVVKNNDMGIWYKYQDTGILTNSYDSIALCLNSADYDGDHVLTTSNKVLVDAAKKANANTILWKRLDRDKIDKDKKDNKLTPISDISKIIVTNCLGMQNNIGNVVNKISVLWSLPLTEEVMKAIKIMSVIGSLTIDFAKSGEAVDVPYDIKQMLKGKKKPEWMKYRHDSDIRNDNVINSNIHLFKMSKEEVDEKRSFEYRPNCTMQKISDYMIKQIDNIKLDFEAVVSDKKFDFTTFMSNKVNKYNKTYDKLKSTLLSLQDDYRIIAGEVFENEEILANGVQRKDDDMRYKIFYDYCRVELLNCNKSNQISNLLDYLIQIFYTEQEFIDIDKSILWNAFADEMIMRANGQFEVKEFDKEKVRAKADKAKVKIDSMKIKSYKVDLKLLQGMNDISINISKNEIKHIKKILDKQEAEQKLLLILLGIYRKEGCKPFKFGSCKKNAINQSNLCKLARFDKDGRQFKKNLKQLLEKGFIKADTSKSLKEPKIEINETLIFTDIFNNTSDNNFSFMDINDYAQFIDNYFKDKLKKTS